MDILSEFLSSHFLWRDPMIVGAFTGAVCGFLGVYVVLRRIIFFSAALTQVSSVGVALAFLLEAYSVGVLAALLHPFTLSLLVTCFIATLFALKPQHSRISQEGIIGFIFLVASALVVILGDRISKGSHDIANILFGNAVVVDPSDVLVVPIVALLVFAIHWIFHKDFVFVSFDTETARLYRYPVRRLNILLLITIAVIVAVSTRALGALPVFALLTLPPLSSLLLSERMLMVFTLSIVFGILSAVLGYFFSFVLSIPTGASMAMCAALIFIVSLGWREIGGNYT